MRELNTDRPDQTESPYTVDAGHFQLEMDFFKFTYDHHSPDGVRTETWNVAPVNLKAPVEQRRFTNRARQLHPRTHSAACNSRFRLRRHHRAFEDQPLGKRRGRDCVWRHALCQAAPRFLVLAQWPDGRRRHSPACRRLAGRVGHGSDDGSGFRKRWRRRVHTEWVNSITVSHDIVGKLAGYLEFFSVVGNAPGFDWQGQVDAGLTCTVTNNMQFDFGCNFGVTESAPDFQPFAGFSIRF